MRRQHDTFLKTLYRAGTRDALTLFLPHLAARIDWEQWEWIDKEIPILGRKRGSVVADLVGRTRDREGRYLEVLLHPEVQMRTHVEMGWRAQLYNAGLVLREGQPRTRVITVVFYHCPGLGGIRRQRFDMDFYEEPSLLGVTYWTVGLGDLQAEPYAEMDNPMGWALASWMRQTAETRVDLRLRLMEKILRFVRVETYQELLLDAVQTYYKLSRSEQRAEARLLRTGQYGEVEEMAQTVLGRMKAKERREGRQEGEGVALQAALLEVIHARFPAMPDSLSRQIEAIRDPARLRQLVGPAATVGSLEEFSRLVGQ